MNITVVKNLFMNDKCFLWGEQLNINQEYYQLLRERLKIKKVVGKNLIRVGKANDGGYIMVDNFNISGGGVYRIFFRHQ